MQTSSCSLRPCLDALGPVAALRCSSLNTSTQECGKPVIPIIQLLFLSSKLTILYPAGAGTLQTISRPGAANRSTTGRLERGEETCLPFPSVCESLQHRPGSATSPWQQQSVPVFRLFLIRRTNLIAYTPLLSDNHQAVLSPQRPGFHLLTTLLQASKL